MGSFFIISEISGLQQMLNLKDSSVKELLIKSERLIYNSLRVPIEIRGSFLFFRIDTNIENANSVIEAAKNLLKIICSYSDELHEFSMALIYKENVNTDIFFGEIKKKYFIFNEDYALVIENKIYQACGMKVLTKKKYQVVRCDSSERKSVKRLEKIIDKKEEEKLKGLISLPLFSPEKKVEESNIYVVNSDLEVFALFNVRNAVAKSFEKKDDNFIHIHVVKGESDCIMPFYRSIKQELFEQVEKNLSKHELNFWKLNKYRIENFQQEYSKESFFCIYLLYIKAAFRIAESKMNSKIFLLSGLDNCNEGFLEYFSTLFEIISKEFLPILFLIQPASRISSQKKLSNFFKNAKQINCKGNVQISLNFQNESNQQKIFLFILKLAEGILSKEELISFLLSFGYGNSEIDELLRDLKDSGWILDGRFINVFANIPLDDFSLGLYDKKDIYIAFVKYLEKLIKDGIVFDYGLAAKKITDFAGTKEIDEILYLLIEKLLDYRKTDFVLDFLENCKQLSIEIKQALILRLNLIDANKTKIMGILDSIIDFKVESDNLEKSLKLFEVSKYFYTIKEFQKSLDISKKILISIQSQDCPLLEGKTFLEIGFIMLCKGKLVESSEYLNLAIEKFSRTNDKFNIMRTYLINALQQYIWGSFDSAIVSVKKSINYAIEGGFNEWYFTAAFFASRIYFEIGLYADAAEILWDCLSKNEVMKNKSRDKVLKSWLARSCLYQGKVKLGLNMLLKIEEDPEVLFFLAEAYYLKGNVKESLEKLEKTKEYNEYFEPSFLPMECLDWKNGFSYFEDRIFFSEKKDSVMKKNIKAFHAFLLSFNEKREEGIELFFHLTRGENLYKNDPFNGLYLNYYYQLLSQRSDITEIDKLTVMSKALKYLQQTASRIKTPMVRQQFMNKNYWNSILVKNAQKEKLL